MPCSMVLPERARPWWPSVSRNIQVVKLPQKLDQPHTTKTPSKPPGLEYAIMSGGDVAPLEEQAVTELHKLFRRGVHEWNRFETRNFLVLLHLQFGVWTWRIHIPYYPMCQNGHWQSLMALLLKWLQVGSQK